MGVVWTFLLSSFPSLLFLPLFGRRLVGCFGFNGPLRQYFSLYRAVSQREGERGERIDESKNVQTTPTRTTCKCSRPLPYCNPIVERPGTGSLPSTIAPPDHPLWETARYRLKYCLKGPFNPKQPTIIKIA